MHCKPTYPVPFISILGILLLALLPLQTARAQNHQSGERNWQVALGLGTGHRNNPLSGGEATDINYVVDLSWYGDRFFFDNGDLGYTLTTSHDWSFNTLLTFSNERNDYNFLTGRQFGVGNSSGGNSGLINTAQPGKPTDNTDAGNNIAKANSPAIPSNSTAAQTLPGPLAHRDTAINGGFELLYIGPLGDVQAQVLSDISNTYQGQMAWLSWSHPWFTRNSEVSLTAGLEWKSRQLVGYYYGVRPEEASPGRPVYDGAAGTNIYLRLSGRYDLTPHWSLAAMAEREFLSSAITSSPVVTTNKVDTFFTGLFYKF